MATKNHSGTAAPANPSEEGFSHLSLTEEAATLRTALQAERRLANTWLDVLQAMRANKQLPEYFKSLLFPWQNADPQYDAWRAAKARTNTVLRGDKAPPPYKTIGADCSGRLNDITALDYYVKDGANNVVAQGLPSELCCVAGLPECLSARQLQFLAVGLAHEARLMRAAKGGAA